MAFVRALLSFVFSFSIFFSFSQNTPAKFILETHYLLSLPEGYNVDTAKNWPLMIFLHGSGERGNDLTKVKAHGPPKLVEQGKRFPFILVSPQATVDGGWDANILYKMLLHIKQTQRVDENKIYLTGLSMGGYGTWELAMAHPEEFAAIAPVCGGGDSSKAWRLQHVAVWNFHGAKDDVVVPEQSENMVKAARRHNSSVRYTLYPEANHNSWDLTYSNDSLYSWLLAQSKFQFKEKAVEASTLKEYVGKYVADKKDTIGIILKGSRLMALPGRDSITIRSFDTDKFYIAPRFGIELYFQRKSGKVKSMMVMDSNRTLYRKID
jgi:predicted esterase